MLVMLLALDITWMMWVTSGPRWLVCFLCLWGMGLLFKLRLGYLLIRLVFYSISARIKVEITSLRLNINLTLRLINRSELLVAHFWLPFKAF